MDLGMFVIGNGNLLNSHYYIIGGGMWMCLVRKKIRLVGINKSYFFSSGATRIRTGDTRIFSPMLYLLSYGTNWVAFVLRVQR